MRTSDLCDRAYRASRHGQDRGLGRPDVRRYESHSSSSSVPVPLRNDLLVSLEMHDIPARSLAQEL